jgi:Flp pilus assembly protein TadG
MSRLTRRADHGATLVEFALLLPVVAILVCGVIDLGRFYSAWNEAKNAAREGALFGQVLPNQQRAFGGGPCADPNNVQARVEQELGDQVVSDGFTITITPTVSSCNPSAGGIEPPANITVSVSRPMTLITPLVRNLLGSPTVRATVTMAVQG